MILLIKSWIFGLFLPQYYNSSNPTLSARRLRPQAGLPLVGFFHGNRILPLDSIVSPLFWGVNPQSGKIQTFGFYSS